MMGTISSSSDFFLLIIWDVDIWMLLIKIFLLRDVIQEDVRFYDYIWYTKMLDSRVKYFIARVFLFSSWKANIR